MADESVWLLKSWSHFFQAICSGEKKHDLRDFNERDFKVGDLVVLREYDNIRGLYTGAAQNVRITYITSRDVPCALSSAVLNRDYAILSYALEGPEYPYGSDGAVYG